MKLNMKSLIYSPINKINMFWFYFYCFRFSRVHFTGCILFERFTGCILV